MSASLLTMGGIAALVATGWTQVKNVFSYVSSFILVGAELGDIGTKHMTYYLRENWKLLPSGLQLYISEIREFRDRKNRTIVWRMPALKAIYHRNKRVLFVSGSKTGMKITYIRGTVNLDKLQIEAAAYWDKYSDTCNDDAVKNSRYMVFDIMGDEGNTSSRRKRNSDDLGETAPASDSSISTADAVYLNTSRDVPINYTLDEFNWRQVDDPFASLYYSPEVLKYIKQAKRWSEMRDWYIERKLMWRRGWMLHGGPGTGKSSLARATAQAMGIPIYRFHLATLTDQEFIRQWKDMSTSCVALMEDFDNVFHGRINITKDKLLNFDTVLNCISGVDARTGIFLIVTTNDLSKIDPAMGVVWGEEGARSGISTRPGRIDTVIEVGNMNAENRRKLASRILIDCPEEVEPLVLAGEDVSPVQFEEMCAQRALVLMEEREFGVPPTEPTSFRDEIVSAVETYHSEVFIKLQVPSPEKLAAFAKI
jgi:DNA replication protein DnaC